jgi:hypothetical protein
LNKSIGALLIVLGLSIVMVTAIPYARANSLTWNLGELGTYPSSITVGKTATVAMAITVNQATDVHVSFKGHFDQSIGDYWTGDWTYEEQSSSLSAGNFTLTLAFSIPYDLYVESLAGSGSTYHFLAQYYYFYVWAAPPGGTWNGRIADNTGSHYQPGKAGVSTSTVTYPPKTNHDLLTTAIRMVRDIILPPPGQPDTFPGSRLLRTILVEELNRAKDIVDAAFAKNNMNQLRVAGVLIRAFMKELQFNKETASWSKTPQCLEMCGFILSWMNNLT